MVFQPDYKEKGGYITLWEKEFKDVKRIFGRQNIIYVEYENNMIQILDFYTSNMIDEFYSLWDPIKYKYEDGILYCKSRNNIYAITPITEW